MQAGIDTDTKTCRFVAEIDRRTTDMCETLNNQIFKLNEMNVYQRYSDLDKRIVTYKTKGLVQGENLPPINNHFHYCRSTITYLIDMKYNELLAEYIQLKKIIPKQIPDSLEKYAKLRYNNDNYYQEIKEKEEIGKHYNKDIEIGEKKKTLSFEEYYNKVKETRKYLRNIQAKDIDTVGEITLHAVDRMIDRNIFKEEIKDILENPKNKWETPINNSIVYFKDRKMVAIDKDDFNLKTVYRGRGKK